MNPQNPSFERLRWESAVHPEESSVKLRKDGKWYFPLGRPTTQVSRTHISLTKSVGQHQHQTLTLIELARTCWAILSNICKVVCRNGPTAPVHLRHCIPGLQEQHPSHLGHLQYKGSKRTLSSFTGFSSKCWCTLQKVCFLEAAKGTLADSEIDTSVALIPAVNYASRILGQNSLFSLIIKSKE